MENSEAEFSTARLLVGEFTAADKALNIAFASVEELRVRKPKVLIQPLEYLEGVLSQVEERVLLELATGKRGRQVLVWVGPELADAEVVEKLMSL